MGKIKFMQVGYSGVVGLATWLFMFLSLGCTNNGIQTNSITVSILPQKYLVEKLIGDTFEVNVMIPEGNNPATYEPTPAQMKKVSRSSLYLRIGHVGFEQAWMNRIQALNSGLKLVDTSEGIELIRGDGHQHGDHFHEGGIDPHVWTSPKMMLAVLSNTKQALLEQFPELEQQINANAKELLNIIQALDKEFTSTCSSVKSNKFIIFHPAYTYLARDYGLEQISIEHMGKEPSAKWLKEVTDFAKEHHIKMIFIQREFDKRNAEIIAKEIGIPVIEVNPLAEQWEQEMKNTLKYLSEALN